MNETNKTCSHLSGSTIFGFESAVLLILTFGSLTSNFIFLKVLLSCGGHLPLNTKLLLINCTVATLGKSAYFLLRVVYNFCLIIFGFAEIEFSRSACIVVELPYAVCTIAIVLSMIYIGVERLYATLYMKNLGQAEMAGTRMYVAQLSIWILSLGIYVVSMLVDGHLAPAHTCYCYFPLIRAPSGGVIMNVVFVGTQTVNIFIYVFVYWQNRRILFEFTLNTARHSLSDRFVMWTNVKATRMLLPDSIMHALTYDLGALFLLLMSQAYSGQLSDNYICIISVVHCVLCLDTLLHPVMCLCYNQSLRDIALNTYPTMTSLFLCKCFPRKSDNVVEQNEAAQVDEFVGVQKEKFRKLTNADTSADKKPPPDVAVDVKKIKLSTCTPATVSHHLSKAQAIVEYRLKPEEHKDILMQMWDLNVKQKRSK